MHNSLHHQAELGCMYSSAQIDELFGVSGKGAMRTDRDHQILVLIQENDAPAAGVDGCLTFYAQPDMDPTAAQSLDLLLEQAPENGVELDLFARQGKDLYTYLGHARRHNFPDGLRHHSLTSAQNAYLLEPEFLPDCMQPKLDSRQSVITDQLADPLDPDEQEWNAAAAGYMEDIMQDLIWPANTGDISSPVDLSVFWQHSPDLEESLILEENLEPQAYAGCMDAAAAENAIVMLAGSHLLKSAGHSIPEIMIIPDSLEMDENDPWQSRWSQWRH